jgi:Lrp/AsnC family transcriptional regulator, leucine-responsive regulatory protein
MKTVNGVRVADAKDLHILPLIQKYCMLTHAVIGNQVGLEASVVSRRIQELEKEKYILGYQAVLSREKLGFPETVFALVRLKVHEAGPFRAFRDELLPVQFPNVVECSKLMGPWDFLLKVVCKNTKEYDDFVVALAGHKEYVERIESHPVMWPVGDLHWKSPILPI